MANDNQTIEVAKSPAGTAPESGVISDTDNALMSTYEKSGSAAVMDNTVTREVVSATTLPLDYQYDEKQMMANMTAAISSDIQDMTETELLEDKTFGYASKKMFRAFRGEDFTGTDEEATQYGINLMRQVENNLVNLGDFAAKTTGMSQEEAKTALFMMDMFEAKDFTGRGFVEALGYMGLDPTTYIGIGTLGYGFAGKEVAKQATKRGVRAALQKVAYSPAAIGAIEGGVYTGAFEHGKQTVSESAGEGYDSGSLGLNIALGAGFGAAANKYLPELFDYAGDKVAKWAAAKNFKKEVQLAADAGDEDAVKVLADMELLDNHFDSDGFMRRKLDEFEQTRVGRAITGTQNIISNETAAKQAKEITKNGDFKKWFKGSKVVNEDGEPMVVYHGTNKEFENFDPSVSFDGGLWFTSDLNALKSGEVGAGSKGIVKEAYLKIDNMAGWNEYEKYSLGELISQGYDGVKLDNDFIVFEDNQIKKIRDFKIEESGGESNGS